MNEFEGDTEILRRILAAIRAERVKLGQSAVRLEGVVARITPPKGEPVNGD
jgi:hypothetical protein